MFEEYLEADGDENDTARNLRRLLKRAPKRLPTTTPTSEDEGRAADDQRGATMSICRNETDADGQRVDARGDGEHEELAQIELLRGGFVVLFLSPSSWKASQSIFPPTKASRAKAIQWSTAVT